MMLRRKVLAAIIASLSLSGSISLAAPPMDGAGPAPPMAVTLVRPDEAHRREVFGIVNVRFSGGEMTGLVIYLDPGQGSFWRTIGIEHRDVLLSVRTRDDQGRETVLREPAGALLERIEKGGRMRLEVESRATRQVRILDLDVRVIEMPVKA